MVEINRVVLTSPVSSARAAFISSPAPPRHHALPLPTAPRRPLRLAAARYRGGDPDLLPSLEDGGASGGGVGRRSHQGSTFRRRIWHFRACASSERCGGGAAARAHSGSQAAIILLLPALPLDIRSAMWRAPPAAHKAGGARGRLREIRLAASSRPAVGDWGR